MERRTFAPGEPIDWPNGIFFMDTETGAVDAIRIRAEGFTGADYLPLAAGRYVRVRSFNTSPGLQFLYDREERAAWTWKPDDYWATPAGRFMLFTAIPGIPMPSKSPVLVHEGLGIVRTFEPGEDSAFVIDPDRGDGYWLSSGGTGNELVRFDALTGATETRPLPGALASGPVTLRPTVDGRGLYLRRSDQPPDDTSDWPAREDWVARFRGDFVQLPGACSQGTTPVISPNGQLFAYEEVEWAIEWYGEGLILGWPVVYVCAMATGEPLFRIRSAALFYPSEYQTSRWLADSSGLCVEVRAERLPGEASARGYAIARISQARVTGFDYLPAINPVGAENSDRFPEGLHAAAIPSPFEQQKVALGKRAVYDTRTGRSVEANIAVDAGPTDLDPWSAGRDEIVFVLPQLGRGARGPWPLLPARVQEPPFASVMRFSVATPGDTLNLRRTPGLDGEVVARLQYRTELDLIPRGEDEPATSDFPEDPTTVLRWDEATRTYTHWVHVITPDRQRGWVSLDYLEWA